MAKRKTTKNNQNENVNGDAIVQPVFQIIYYFNKEISLNNNSSIAFLLYKQEDKNVAK